MALFRGFIAVTLLLLVGAPVQGAEFDVLFNGKNLDGWVAEGQTEIKADGQVRPVWSAQDGKLVCEGKGFGFLRYADKEYGDFLFHVEFRMNPKCNSGLGIRTGKFNPAQSKATRPSFYSYEIQLTDDAGKPTNTLSSGSLYRYVAPSRNAMKPASEWNTIEVECVGPRIKVNLNGDEIINVDQATIPALKDKPLKGNVCLQNHGGTIEFREIRIKDLATSTAAKPAPAPENTPR